MKCNRMLLVLCTLGVSIQLQAKDFQEMKCFVQTSFGEKIAFFNWPADEVTKMTHQLAGSAMGKERGVANYVKKVVECVPMEQEFRDSAARERDKKTLK